MQRLAALQKIEVKQRVEMLEAMTGFETNNQYEIRDGAGKSILQALEDSSTCSRLCCGPRRPFVIRVTDETGAEAIRVTREYKCLCIGQCCSCFGCCQDCVMVEAPAGNVVGWVRQECSLCSANFSIRDADDNVVLHLKGPCYCGCRCPGSKYKFRMLSADESHEVGKLNKEWTGFVKEMMTDADNFSLEVPGDMAVETKATLVAAVFLIDFMFFEDNSKKKKKNVHPVAH